MSLIVTRTPLRLSLGGGGTDLPAYYSRYGGAWTSAAINKYVYIVLNSRFESNIHVRYSATEIVEHVDAIRHPIVREALRLVGVTQQIEVVSIADIPANTGLGSSGAFTVGLLLALHAYKGEPVSPEQLAEEAFTVESDIVGDPSGKQDPYIAAFGGVTSFAVDRAGCVRVEQHGLEPKVIDEFERRVLLFSTGIRRAAAEILEEQRRKLSRDDGGTVAEALQTIGALGHEVRKALERGDLRGFGGLLHRHWEAKRAIMGGMSSNLIDTWYEIGRDNGAVGGKLVGAGGGGFLMFYCEERDSEGLRAALTDRGLRELRYSIEFAGAKVLLDGANK